MSAHTPGEWAANPKRLVIETGQGPVHGPLMSYLVGDRASGEGMTVSIASERVADHYLCAAAPDLLAQLSHVVRFWDQLTPEDIERYKSVISKATLCPTTAP